MAYVKYKELTKYFNFNSEFDLNKLPSYTLDYLIDNEIVYRAYKTKRDKGLFTNKRMILFDVKPIFNTKKIHIIPYNSISSGAILFNKFSAAIFFSFDSGYQLKLKFINMNAENKNNLRLLFSYIMENRDKNK